MTSRSPGPNVGTVSAAPVTVAAVIMVTIAAMIGTTIAATPAGAAPSGSAPSAPSAPGATRSVIVVLRDQPASNPTRALTVGRRAAARSAQTSLLTQVGSGQRTPTAVVHYTGVNAFSATLTTGQAARLAGDPSVAAVIPDARIVTAPALRPGDRPATARGGSPARTAALSVPAGVCPKDPAKPLLEPEALSDTRAASDVPGPKTAQALGIDGAGVKVGYIADGIDPAAPDFIRADGTRVITDYRAFTADGPAPSQGGAEAYGDASAIAAQGRVAHDLSTFVDASDPLPHGCTIRIRGMAPGASLVALKTDFTTTSIVQAIDYAVNTAHVAVLNESFGFTAIPDASTRQVISLFNDMAVAAGTTVTVSSGDAGATNTIASPATDPRVISVAASTTSRSYAQTGYAGARAFGSGAWANDEISALSSGGVTQGGRTVDLAAPGESGWAACDAGSAACQNNRTTTSDVQLFGGTSQSAPLAAGAAALVIQAYRRTHAHRSPSPALVKQLLTSTATDLGESPELQGSGLLDARAAVEAALTYPGAGPARTTGLASNIALTRGQTSISGAPGSSHRVTLGVRNVGSKRLTVAVGTRDFAPVGSRTLSTTLSGHSPTFGYPVGDATWRYQKINFAVPTGVDRLLTAAAWPSTPRTSGQFVITPTVRVSLFRPDGAFVTNSRPQGGDTDSSNYANLSVTKPPAGTWTAVVYSPAGASGYTGSVALRTTLQRAVSVGTVSHPVLTLAPGQSRRIAVRLRIPAAGDATQAITVASSDGHRTAVGVVERAVVHLRRGRGAFAATITGGNGRIAAPAQSLSYAVDVPPGARDIEVGASLADDPHFLLEGLLVDPNGEVRSVGTNAYSDITGTSITGQGRTMQLTTTSPQPGRWRVVVQVQSPVPGAELGEKLRGTVMVDRNRVVANGLPTSPRTTLPRGTPTGATVRVTNTGVAPINVQLDPRTASVRELALDPRTSSSTVSLASHQILEYLVPPGTAAVTAVATSTVPVLAGLRSATRGVDVVGDLEGGQHGSTVSVARVAEDRDTVTPGLWYADADTVGPTASGGATTNQAIAHLGLSARTADFDRAVTTGTGDFWLSAVSRTARTGTPVTIQPGASATIPVTITPTARVGAVVSGRLNVITPPSFASAGFATTGDTLCTLSYRYTVGPPRRPDGGSPR